MHEIVKTMLNKYTPQNLTDYENALHEIIQEIALLGLWRAKFFEHAAFYGGTALRVLYGLDRFSEDLDFSLVLPDRTFDLSTYNTAVKEELSSFGFEATVETRGKNTNNSIKSAFIKTETKKQLLKIDIPESLKKIHKQRLMKIKMELDVDPPPAFEVEAKLLLQPVPFSVNTYKLPYLFAGKLHALLCRAWQQRVKGRDWYDFVWYVGNKIPVNITHLRARLIQSGHWDITNSFDKTVLRELLHEKINRVDFEQAKLDVIRFIRDPDSLALWSKEFFLSVTEQLKYED